MPGSAATRTLQSHRYGDFAENGDDDSDEDEDNGRSFATVCLLRLQPISIKVHALHMPDDMPDSDLMNAPHVACAT